MIAVLFVFATLVATGQSQEYDERNWNSWNSWSNWNNWSGYGYAMNAASAPFGYSVWVPLLVLSAMLVAKIYYTK